MREDIVIRNYGDEPSYCSLELLFDTDFADLFHVKEGRFESDITPALDAEGDDIVFRYQRGLTRRGVRISFSQHVQLAANRATLEIIVPPQESWETCVQLAPIIENEEIEPRHLCGQPVDHATPRARLAKWRSQVPAVDTDYPHLKGIVTRSAEDLGALRIFDPDYPERAVVRRRSVVHDPVRPRLAAHVVDGGADRSRPGPGRPADAGPVPRVGSGSAHRR